MADMKTAAVFLGNMGKISPTIMDAKDDLDNILSSCLILML